MKETLSIHANEDPIVDKCHLTLVKELVEVEIVKPKSVVKIGVSLPEERSKAFTELLRNFKEMFTWSPKDCQALSLQSSPMSSTLIP